MHLGSEARNGSTHSCSNINQGATERRRNPNRASIPPAGINRNLEQCSLKSAAKNLPGGKVCLLRVKTEGFLYRMFLSIKKTKISFIWRKPKYSFSVAISFILSSIGQVFLKRTDTVEEKASRFKENPQLSDIPCPTHEGCVNTGAGRQNLWERMNPQSCAVHIQNYLHVSVCERPRNESDVWVGGKTLNDWGFMIW